MHQPLDFVFYPVPWDLSLSTMLLLVPWIFAWILWPGLSFVFWIVYTILLNLTCNCLLHLRDYFTHGGSRSAGLVESCYSMRPSGWGAPTAPGYVGCQTNTSHQHAPINFYYTADPCPFSPSHLLPQQVFRRASSVPGLNATVLPLLLTRRASKSI